MFCSQCGSKLEDGTKFCWNCGAPVVGTTIQVGESADATKVTDGATNKNATNAEDTVDKAVAQVQEAASEVADTAAETLDKAKETGAEVLDKAKEVGGETLDKAKEVGAEALDKTIVVGGEALDKAKEVASETLDKAKAQFDEFNKRGDANTKKIVIVATLVILALLGGILFWFFRPLNQAERFVDDRVEMLVTFLKDSDSLSAKEIDEEMSHWDGIQPNAQNQVNNGLSLKQAQDWAQNRAITTLGRAVEKNIKASDFKIIEKGEYKIHNRDAYVFLIEKQGDKKVSTRGYLVGIAKDAKGDFYVDTWLPLNEKQLERAKVGIEQGALDDLKQ